MIQKIADKFAGRRLVANMRAVEQVGDYYFDEPDGAFFLCDEVGDSDYFLEEFEPLTGYRLFRAGCALFLIVASLAGGLFWIFARTST